MRTKMAGKLGGIKARIWFLVVLCASLCLGCFPARSAPPYPLDDAIACDAIINFNGNNVLVDSFNSANPAYSDWNASLGCGTYDSAKAEAHGNVETASFSSNALNLGQAVIYGHVNTGPGGTISIGTNGYVGPLPQVGYGIQPGYSNDYMVVVFPDVVLPAGASGWASVPSSGVITTSGVYYSAGISGNLSINAPYVTIYVNGIISISGNSAITITTNVVNASLYVAGPLADIGGNGVVNTAARAAAFNIYGLPSLTALYIHNNGDYVGTVYAPEAAFTFRGQGSAGTFVGALVAHTFLLTGNASFHFDESLFQTWIYVLPTNRTVQPGTNVTFVISVVGGYPQDYQWFFNQTNLLVGATNATLSLTNVQFTDAGTYSIVATNWSGSITSALASLIVYTNAAATLTAPVLLTNGLQFSITGVTGLNYIVQSSTNLANWVSLATNQPPFTFVDTNAPGFPQQFYRAICYP